jgi:hypothetical protein
VPPLTCAITLTSDAIVGLGFGFFSFGIPALNEHAFVTVEVGGAGSGRIVEIDSRGRGTTCENSTCSREFDLPEFVTVRAEPSSPSSRFDRWLNGCPPAAQSCQINTRFLTSLAVCFKPASPPHALEALTLRRRNGNWRIILGITPPSNAAVIRLRLTRHTKTAFAFPAIHATGGEQTLSLKVPRWLPSGSYVLQATVSDRLQCTTKLSPRAVKLSQRR